MATSCFTPIRGRRARFTPVDNCGRPRYGDCTGDTPSGFVTTKGFITVNISADVSEAEEIEQKNAAGEICISEPGCDQLRWYTVEIQFCSVDPDLAVMINPSWKKLLDYQGNTIGWAESLTQSCDSGYALELWTDVVADTNVCDDVQAQGQWGYILMSWLVGGTVGDLTVENGPVTFTFTGRTKVGSSWGAGPYDVMLNAGATPEDPAAPGPLIEPVGPDEPRRIMLTTVPPPDDACGCQPLSNPDGPELTVTQEPAPSLAVTVDTATAPPTGSVWQVNWGDGSAPEELTSGTPLTHTYAEAGTYNISVYASNAPQLVTVETVTVPLPATP